MLDLIWLLPTFPLLGFLVLALAEGRLARGPAGWIGAGSVGLSFAVAALVAASFLQSGLESHSAPLWTWISVAGFDPGVNLYLDGLSLVMVLVITGVGFLIHVYSAGYMADDPDFSRFFCYMNLFVFAMLLLVLGDNLLLLYLGWEGVGLCSYLLIGFWYDDPGNGHAARKAFVVTRVGDTAMAIGLFLLFAELGSLNIQDMLRAAEAEWPAGSTLPAVAALLLLGGAVGKSAQLPLQTWLPDAMAGPTPISALIHAATMVTAGVYLIARTHVLFELAPEVQLLVAWVGLATLLMAGFTAMTQTDIKRILAYSTVSQIGYMFLGLGVGAWSGAIFHLMTHAFFKALLFLGAGAVILSLHHEQDIFRMGGKRRQLPVGFLCFLVGGLALTAFPYTSGYFSKDEILLAALAVEGQGPWLWLGGVVGALLTGIYTFRLFFAVFFGASKGHHDAVEVKGLTIAAPLFALMALSLFGGWIPLPLDHVFNHGAEHEEHHAGALVHGVMIALPLAGIAISYLVYGAGVLPVGKLMSLPACRALHRFWRSGWGMDRLYDLLFVIPFLYLARVNAKDIVDACFDLPAAASRAAHRLLARTQTGALRWYALSMVAGLVLLIAAGLLS